MFCHYTTSKKKKKENKTETNQIKILSNDICYCMLLFCDYKSIYNMKNINKYFRLLINTSNKHIKHFTYDYDVYKYYQITKLNYIEYLDLTFNIKSIDYKSFYHNY